MSKRKKNGNYKNPITINQTAGNSAKTKRYMIIFVCIFLAVAILAGVTIGVVSAIKNSLALMYIDGAILDKGVGSYLASYYKAMYVASLRKELAKDNIELIDTEEFWNSSANGENTYAQALSEFVKSLVSQTVAASRLFDDYTSLSASDREIIETACREKLDFIAGGSKAEFNSQTEKYGFNYSDFKAGTEMLYKSWAANVKIFGNDGEGMSSFTDYLDKYYANYNCAVLLVVRTEKIIATDAEGNKLYGDDRYYLMQDLTEEERAERQRRLELIRAAASGINDGTVAPERFFELWDMYDEGEHENNSGTYYFMTGSDYTKNFGYQDIVSAVKEIEVGKCVEVDLDIGVCFAYKIQNEANGYTLSSNQKFFGDFNVLAASELYTELINGYNKRVEVRDRWSEIDVIKIPYNTDYVAEF